MQRNHLLKIYLYKIIWITYEFLKLNIVKPLYMLVDYFHSMISDHTYLFKSYIFIDYATWKEFQTYSWISEIEYAYLGSAMLCATSNDMECGM